MNGESHDQELFRKERLEMHKLLADNPNYFGSLSGVDLPVVQAIKFNTTYEQLNCVGLWPERNLLEATLVVKLPFGFSGDLCTRGSYEYVRFFIDWDNDGDFTGPNEDLGVAMVNVHDIPQVKEHHLCYAVRRRFKPLLAKCQDPYIVKLRAILSWDIAPTGPNFIPIWGNVLECWVQVDPIEGKILGIMSGEEADTEGQGLSADNPKKGSGEVKSRKSPPLEKERVEFRELLDQNPNYFGTLPNSQLKPVKPIQYDTRYEELECIGLYPERDFLEAILQVKLPSGFSGDLCSGGSQEYVRFFIDWDGEGDFVDLGEDIGVASVNVHDIPQVREFHLCYALGKGFRARRAYCQDPYIVKVRAILSWQQVPTGPNFIPVWGNVVECWVQIRPTRRQPRHLIGVIDTPTANECVGTTLVAACVNASGPLVGVKITGTAGGAPFDHYTLRYSWGADPPINDAVVYPDCSRPPANISSNVPVFGGTLGYLDVTLLPQGQTDFTVYLDVFGTAPTVSATRTFELKTSSVEITDVAKVNALDAEDPFNPGSFTKLIKATNDPSINVPEVSVGGAFSVDGSAYTVGCDRIMSQFVLARFDAPPAAPVPNFPDATGGAPLIAPVPYDDNPSHPWQSGCFPGITTNVITNGDLVAFWSVNNCTFLGMPYTVPKVKPIPFWNSGTLNGRYVVLLEVRDRLLPAGPFPGDFAAKDQVAVWIDNRSPVAELHSIGGITGCGDLHLKDFVGTTAEIRGVAWDPPIDASIDPDPITPKRRPNDNFGSYGMSFQKNGVVPPVSIPGATPTVRVPNIWASILPAGAEGTLANWDIVGALDGGAGPLPPNSPKIARGDRCAYVIALVVSDTTHVGDSGINHGFGPVLYAINVINDIGA